MTFNIPEKFKNEGTEQAIESMDRRLVRIETRLCRLMVFMGAEREMKEPIEAQKNPKQTTGVNQ